MRKINILFFTLPILISCSSETDYFSSQCNKFESHAKKGNVINQISLVHCYLSGQGREKNVDLAIQWLKKAVNKGSIEAKGDLGGIILVVKKSKADYEEALQMLEEAAKSGYRPSYFNLALAYHNGLGVPKDNKKAIDYFSLAAKKGDLLSIFILYAIHELGLYDEPVNIKKGNYWSKEFHENISYDLIYNEEDMASYINAVKKDEIVKEFVFSESELEMLSLLKINGGSDT